MNGTEHQPGPTHCILRRGSSWFAFPAETVREVLFRPSLLAVAQSDPVLAGLCHVRSEFLPVLRLDGLSVDSPDAMEPERQMLIVNGEEGPWGILVDQVAALAELEMSAAPEGDVESGWPEVISGWAAYETQVVRVLDPHRLYNLAERVLCQDWSRRRIPVTAGQPSPQPSEGQDIGLGAVEPEPSGAPPAKPADPRQTKPDEAVQAAAVASGASRQQ